MTADMNQTEYDVVVIGAGFSGLYATYRLSTAGHSVRAFEAGSGVGGVWTWNRYPGARTDSLHETFQFSFDKEFAAGWRYSDIHPLQPEVLDYLNTFADHFDLRRHYSFDTVVKSARYNEATNRWDFVTDTGETATAKYFVTGLGLVSAPLIPSTPGFEDFTGQVVHTSRWPEEGVDFTDKKVAVIGTGSSGVQVAPAIVDQVSELTVFQRTPNWCPPTGHRPVTDAEHEQLLENFDEVWSKVRQHPAGWPWEATGRSIFDVSDAERERIFEECWGQGGFSMLFQAFDDVLVSKEANDILCEFAGRKVREAVKDPAIAEKLIPDHPYGAKRPPASDGYLEMFNRDNVRLVDIRETPIERYTATGIATSSDEFEFDIVVLATGFDAVSGAFTRMDHPRLERREPGRQVEHRRPPDLPRPGSSRVPEHVDGRGTAESVLESSPWSTVCRKLDRGCDRTLRGSRNRCVPADSFSPGGLEPARAGSCPGRPHGLRQGRELLGGRCQHRRQAPRLQRLLRGVQGVCRSL